MFWKKVVVCAALMTVAGDEGVQAQELIPFKFRSEDENKLLTENDSARIYAATGDTANAVIIEDETLHYRLVSRKNKKKVVAEGGLVSAGDGYLQHGKWVQYYSNGRPALTGSYLKGKPAGAWQELWPDGKPKRDFHYAILADKDGTYTCMAGEYHEYYENGQLKVTGFYMADRRRNADTVMVEDPVSGTRVSKKVFTSEYVPRKTGTWEYFTETGEADRKEEL